MNNMEWETGFKNIWRIIYQAFVRYFSQFYGKKYLFIPEHNERKKHLANLRTDTPILNEVEFKSILEKNALLENKC